VDSGWGHFTRIFSGPADPSPVIDYTTIAIYVTVHNNGTTEDRIIGGASSFCGSITFDDMSIVGPDGTIPSIAIPAKSTVIMDFMKEARIMCNGVRGVKNGDRITVGLIFEKFGQVPVWVEIRAT
jgi:copper(I)-binding protein